MCRNIKKLRKPDELPSQEELRGAALQFVRKITGYQSPSRRNTPAFEEAVSEIVDVTRSLFHELESVQSNPRSKVVPKKQKK